MKTITLFHSTALKSFFSTFTFSFFEKRKKEEHIKPVNYKDDPEQYCIDKGIIQNPSRFKKSGSKTIRIE